MLNQTCSYDGVCHQIQPGDVIAFSGLDISSETVKLATGSTVSHVGIILDLTMQGDRLQPLVMESSPIEGFNGVGIQPLATRVSGYAGPIWWLPLKPAVRRQLKLSKFQQFLKQQDKKPYDPIQAINSGLKLFRKIPLLGRATANQENFDQLFCSELAAAGLKNAGVLPSVNPSEMTPHDLCQLAIYQPSYYLLNEPEITDPKRLQINGFNSIDMSD